jgi:ABC-type Fe3+-hydroxamate transport system substrate-binding protein
MITDDLGHALSPNGPASRVVSLVPSLTEAIALTRPGALVGATDWCTHPAGLDVPRVRGTKNPDLGAITALAPDLVIANKEENRELDVRRLRAAGVPVWVTDIRTVPAALDSMRRLFIAALRWDVPAWLEQASAIWAPTTPALDVNTADVRTGRQKLSATAAIAIWRDPWMVVGGDTFTGDLAARVGLANVFADSAERYPHTTPIEIVQRGADLVVLPDEPYVFTADDGPEAFSSTRTVLVEGRLLTWYGPSLLTAYDVLRTALAE